MLAMVIIQFIYLKLGKKGPNTRMCFYTNSCHREQTRTPGLLLTQSVYQQYDQNRLPPQSYNVLYKIRTAKTLDLTDRQIYTQLSIKYSYTLLYSLDNTRQSYNSQTVN